MSRLIEADTLLKRAHYIETEDLNGYSILYPHDVLDAPTVDAVEVVRCKDCKHSGNMPLGLCYLHYENDGDPVACVEPDDFCSYGERK